MVCIVQLLRQHPFARGMPTTPPPNLLHMQKLKMVSKIPPPADAKAVHARVTHTCTFKIGISLRTAFFRGLFNASYLAARVRRSLTLLKPPPSTLQMVIAAMILGILEYVLDLQGG